ncbi:MAG: VIT and VWA domain-containing protein [Planctomycetia bacterium]|nr:VIT and VWA domain-containing protein [Planctomycetia bacterium]
MSRSLACFATLVLLLGGLLSVRPVLAQGLLVNVNDDQHVRLPRPDIWPGPRPMPHPIPMPRPMPVVQGSYKIKELTVEGRIVDQVAKIQVSQTFVNTGSRVMEVAFVFPLPYDGAIDRLTLMVDGQELEAKLLEAKEARQIYESIVRKNQDPALLEWVGTGMFRTSVFPVPPGQERKVTLRYSQLCRKSEGATDFLFPLSTAKYTTEPVDKVEFRLSIESTEPIKNVYSPTHAVEIKRADDRHANIHLVAERQIPSSDFRLLYDTGRGTVGAQVLSYAPRHDEDGFFLLLASPEIEAAKASPPPKTVMFVVDRSGSMSGKKIEQAKAALSFVLNNLQQGDLFNVVAFDTEVESFRPELQRYNDETRKAALGFVDGIYAGGGTNIDGALKTALDQLQDDKRPNYVIFMTDGNPTVGEKNEAQIVAHSRQFNKIGARIFNFGVGYDLNARLLDRLTEAHRGQSEYVRPNEDIEARVSKLYNRIGAPVMTDVTITVDVEGREGASTSATSRVYPKGKHDLFAGDQLVVVGRYRFPGAAKITVRGKVGNEERSFNFPARMTEVTSDERNSFVEKLWATRRIGEIIDQLDLNGRNDEMIKELVELSTKHGILTPYTSFLAEEPQSPRDMRQQFGMARRNLEKLGDASGAGAVNQRAAKAEFKSAPQAAGSGFSRQGYADADKAEQVEVTTVMNVAARAFYRRGGKWVDARATDAMQQSPIKITRFSPEYFALVDKFGKDIARYLAIDGPVVLELGGKAYEF